MAWIDDNLSEPVKEWALARPAPTLLVETRPSIGMTDSHVDAMLAWAAKLAKSVSGRGQRRRSDRLSALLLEPRQLQRQPFPKRPRRREAEQLARA